MACINNKDIFMWCSFFSGLQNMMNCINSNKESGKFSGFRQSVCPCSSAEEVCTWWFNPCKVHGKIIQCSPHIYLFLERVPSTVPQTPAVWIVSFWEELPQWFVNYHYCDWQRGCRLKMAPSPIGRCLLLLLWGISLGWRGRRELCWEQNSVW